jgi:cellulose synthase/poly-beta-1,6-N-acetylglucosamine synthase-like glycosyltransferase
MTIITWLFALTLQDWGAIAAIILTISTIVVWIYTWNLNNKPYKLSYSIIADKIKTPNEVNIESGKFGNEFVTWLQSSNLMKLSENTTYTFRIELKP